MLSSDLNVVALAIYAGSRVTSTTVSDNGLVECEMELTPEAEADIAKYRDGDPQHVVVLNRFINAQTEMRSLVRRARSAARR